MGEVDGIEPFEAAVGSRTQACEPELTIHTLAAIDQIHEPLYHQGTGDPEARPAVPIDRGGGPARRSQQNETWCQIQSGHGSCSLLVDGVSATSIDRDLPFRNW